MDEAGHELGSFYQTVPENATEIFGLKSANVACTLGTFSRFHFIV